jgi:hypothetical protein
MGEIMGIKVLLFSLLFSGSGAFAFSETGLMGKLQDVRASFNWQCTGSACDGVWANQVRMMNDLVQYVDMELPDRTPLSARVGSLAYQTADVICRSTATASVDTLQWLISAENRALGRLQTIQYRAGRDQRNTRTCTMSMR